MARTVFLHVGLPKTGTTYLQTLLWENKAELGRQGVLVPGRSSREHLWASWDLRGEPRLARRHPEGPGAWGRLVEEVNAWPGTAVISHEFLAPATADDARRAAADLGGADVHVVVTARDTLSLVTARWQEFVKNGSTSTIDAYPHPRRSSRTGDWGWGSLDLADVLERWSVAVPAGSVHERVHVLTLPGPEEPREALWLRLATLLGADPASLSGDHVEANQSLGVVEVELLRRVNESLEGFSSAQDRGIWIRGYLAQEKLVPRGGERFWPSPARVERLRERGDRVADAVASAGYDVIGDPGSLRTPRDLPSRRHPADVTDAEVAAAATQVIASMMADVRRLTQENRLLEQPAPTLRRRIRGRAGRAVRQVLAVWRRS